VAPWLIAASLAGKHLTSRRLHPSPCLADKWAPPVITFHRLRLSSVVLPLNLATSGHLSTPRHAAPMPLLPPPLNPSLCRLAFNGVQAITAGCSPPPGPYKRVRSTPGHHHTHPRNSHLTEHRLPPPFPSVSRPPRRRPSSGEALNRFPDPDSPSSAPSPVTLSPGVAGAQAPVSSRARQWLPVHSGPGRRGPWTRGLGPQVFL
jgi:hypothetical protein